MTAYEMFVAVVKLSVDHCLKNWKLPFSLVRDRKKEKKLELCSVNKTVMNSKYCNYDSVRNGCRCQACFFLSDAGISYC